jgi:RimJ/RimL family protein N-acetyltransferase
MSIATFFYTLLLYELNILSRSEPTGEVFIKEVRLKDGSLVKIRYIDVDDSLKLLEMYNSLSQDTIYNRFFVFRDKLTLEEAEKMAAISKKDEIALVGVVDRESSPAIIADARIYIEGDVGEIGIVVQDHWQNKGLGTALVSELIREGEKRGLKRLKIYCLPDNRIMIHVGEKLGFKYSMSELGVVRMILDLPSTKKQPE